MTPQIGNTTQWRRANGRMVQMVVDLIHRESTGEVWLFGRQTEAGVFVAVNQTQVIGCR